jgi:hypothetical protein
MEVMEELKKRVHEQKMDIQHVEADYCNSMCIVGK